MDNNEMEMLKGLASGFDLSGFKGDFVVYKHVDKELNVAAGGIGEVHNHYEAPQAAQGVPADLRYTKMTFKAKVPAERFNAIYIALLATKMIAEETSRKDIIDFFSGEESDCVIRWVCEMSEQSAKSGKSAL